MEKLDGATNVILKSILNDPTRKNELIDIVKDVDSSEARAAAIRNYCGKSLRNCLSVERNVVEALISRTSWSEIATHIETLIVQTDKNATN